MGHQTANGLLQAGGTDGDFNEAQRVFCPTLSQDARHGRNDVINDLGYGNAVPAHAVQLLMPGFVTVRQESFAEGIQMLGQSDGKGRAHRLRARQLLERKLGKFGHIAISQKGWATCEVFAVVGHRIANAFAHDAPIQMQ